MRAHHKKQTDAGEQGQEQASLRCANHKPQPSNVPSAARLGTHCERLGTQDMIPAPGGGSTVLDGALIDVWNDLEDDVPACEINTFPLHSPERHTPHNVCVMPKNDQQYVGHCW